MEEKFTFDKFVDDIVVREEQQREVIAEHQRDQDDHPARVYNRLYRERWQNRIKWNDRR
jgi:hypothetical protein